MHTSLTEIEQIARQQIHERSHPAHVHHEVRSPQPPTRHRLAGTLRRIADRLDG